MLMLLHGKSKGSISPNKPEKDAALIPEVCMCHLLEISLLNLPEYAAHLVFFLHHLLLFSTSFTSYSSLS